MPADQLLLPERTVDGWTAIEIQRALPRVRLWLPSQRRQATPGGEEPWDIAVGGLHAFVFESKGLFRRSGLFVKIERRQHRALLEIEDAVKDYVWYCLPAPTNLDLKGLSPNGGIGFVPSMTDLRYRRGFGNFMRVLSPSELGKAAAAAGASLPKLGDPFPTRKAYTEIPTDKLARRGSRLNRFLETVAACKITPPGTELVAAVREAEPVFGHLNQERMIVALVPGSNGDPWSSSNSIDM